MRRLICINLEDIKPTHLWVWVEIDFNGLTYSQKPINLNASHPMYFLLEGEPNSKVKIYIFVTESLETEGSSSQDFKFLLKNINNQELSLNLGAVTIRLNLTVQDDNLSVRVAPPITSEQSDEIPDRLPFAVYQPIDSFSLPTQTLNQSTVNQIEKYICQPGTYSGDVWHIAAALLLDESVKVVVPRYKVQPYVLTIQAVNFTSQKPLYYEIQLRSSLGIITTLSSEHELPLTFYYSGYVEFWIDAWVADNTQVLQFSKESGKNNLNSPLSFQVEASHSLSWESFQNYVDEYAPLTKQYKPLVLEIQYSVQPMSTVPGQELTELQSFALENLKVQLVPLAKPIIETLVGQLLNHLHSQYSLNLNTPANPQELELALLENICKSPRRLFIGDEQMVKWKIRRRCENEWIKFLLRQPITKVSVEAIEQIKSSTKQFQINAAEALFNNLNQVVNPSKKLEQIKSKYVLKSNQFLDFYADCGIDQSRVITGILEKSPQSGSIAYAKGRSIVTEKCYGDPPYGMTFAATSVLMHAVEKWGINSVCKKLVFSFTKNLVSNEVKKIQEKIKVLEGSPCVLLNMRLGGYHPEHDVTPGIYKQIDKFAKEYNLRLIRVGGPKELPWQIDSDVTSIWLDIYSHEDESSYMPKEVDLRHTAYLWSEVAQLENVVGIIGGMSGSLDIAAYMGVRTLCWDVALQDAQVLNQVSNTAEFQDRIRLLLSYPFMSIVHRQITEGLIDTQSKKLKDDSKEENILDSLALKLWFAGQHIIPTINKTSFQPSKVVQTSNESSNGFKAVLFYNLPNVIAALLGD